MTETPQADDWRGALAELAARREPHALVTVIAIEGSAPRGPGAKMVVTASGQIGSIGGGHLELKATALARAAIAARDTTPRIERFALGPQLGQCCGGRVTLLIEGFISQSLSLTLFGAGHVGRALVDVLAGIDVRIAWIDSRDGQFPPLVPAGVETILADDPADEVDDLPAGCYAVVMTHRHDTDLAIVEKLLRRNDLPYVGVIGSATKRARFAGQLVRRGIAAEAVARLRCPIGIAGITSKRPRDIAIAVAAELLRLRDSGAADADAAVARATP